MPKRKAEHLKADDGDDAPDTKQQKADDSTPYPDFKRPHAEECMVCCAAGLVPLSNRASVPDHLWIRTSIVAQAACRALADLHGAPENPFRQKEMDSKDMKAVQSALSEVTSTQRTVLDSTVRAR